jgi:hypothetical protein
MELTNNKRVVDITVDELVEAVVTKLEEREDKETVDTDTLAEILQCSPATIGVYGRAGMYEAPGCRVKKNCWNPKKCKKWVETEYQKLLSKSRTRKMLKPKK